MVHTIPKLSPTTAPPERARAASHLWGSGNVAKPTDEQVRVMRAEAKHWGRGAVRMFAMRFGLSQRTVSLILNGRTHADVA